MSNIQFNSSSFFEKIIINDSKKNNFFQSFIEKIKLFSLKIFHAIKCKLFKKNSYKNWLLKNIYNLGPRKDEKNSSNLELELKQIWSGIYSYYYMSLCEKHVKELNDQKESLKIGNRLLSADEKNDIESLVTYYRVFNDFSQFYEKREFNLIDVDFILKYLNELEKVKSELIIHLPDGSKSFYLPGGRKGHAVIYEFKKTFKGSYQFIIHNSGATDGNSTFYSTIKTISNTYSQKSVIIEIKKENKDCLYNKEFLLELINTRQKESMNFAHQYITNYLLSNSHALLKGSILFDRRKIEQSIEYTSLCFSESILERAKQDYKKNDLVLCIKKSLILTKDREKSKLKPLEDDYKTIYSKKVEEAVAKVRAGHPIFNVVEETNLNETSQKEHQIKKLQSSIYSIDNLIKYFSSLDKNNLSNLEVLEELKRLCKSNEKKFKNKFNLGNSLHHKNCVKGCMKLSQKSVVTTSTILIFFQIYQLEKMMNKLKNEPDFCQKEIFSEKNIKTNSSEKKILHTKRAVSFLLDRTVQRITYLKNKIIKIT